MSELRVERGSTARLDHVDGDLRVSSNARITAAKGNLVTVSGSAYFESNAEIDCDFQCDSLTVERGTLRSTGNLVVNKEADVAHTLKVEGKISAQRIEVGGRCSRAPSPAAAPSGSAASWRWPRPSRPSRSTSAGRSWCAGRSRSRTSTSEGRRRWAAGASRDTSR